jgi:sterol desaturase/sphingolipid hydroxylase (fatty acid hydroxylase superfamily)
LVKWLGLPPWLEVPITLILLDYLLYLWHAAFQKMPFLWRFHQVHHVDLDMDASTAIRFHFGEIAMSTALQTFQILSVGVTPLTFSIWNTWLISEIMFHHSNVELPFGVERWLCKIIVTPRMHGIHHSVVPEELNSNWSSGLMVWDWLHGTLRLECAAKPSRTRRSGFSRHERAYVSQAHGNSFRGSSNAILHRSGRMARHLAVRRFVADRRQCLFPKPTKTYFQARQRRGGSKPIRL